MKVPVSYASNRELYTGLGPQAVLWHADHYVCPGNFLRASVHMGEW